MFHVFGGVVNGPTDQTTAQTLPQNDVLVLDRFGTTTNYGLTVGGFDGGSFIVADGSTARGIARLDYTGGSGEEAIGGGLGNDTLRGGSGIDLLYGGAGNVDPIGDFSVADDTIRLENAIFTAVGAPGLLAASAFKLGVAANEADDRIIYNSVTGYVFYDPNGSGGSAMVNFAELTAGLALTHADFLVS